MQYTTGNLLIATRALLIASVAAIITKFALERKVSTIYLCSFLLLCILGSITLLTSNKVFIKFKPTITFSVAGIIFFASTFFRTPMLSMFLGKLIETKRSNWILLSRVLAMFLIVLAICNEVIRRIANDGTWVTFKTILAPISIVIFLYICMFALVRSGRANWRK